MSVRDAWNEHMLERAAADMREQNAREAVTFELPKHGPVSWDNIERCAREAGMSVHDWVADALAAHVRMHECDAYEPMPEYAPAPAPIPRWRARIAEWAYRLADRLTDDGTER